MKFAEQLKILYPHFPRHFAKPERKAVNSFEELMKQINDYNGICRCYCSIYNFPDIANLVVDKVCFDFDDDSGKNGDIRCLVDTKALHEKVKDVKHAIVFSGRGFHVYIFTDSEKLQNPKEAIKNFQTKMEVDLELMLDRTIKGDIARILTIPGTFNIRRNRFAIFVSDEDLKMGYEYIKEKAKKQHSELTIYGEKLLSLKEFDTATVRINMEDFKMTDYNETVEEEVLKNAPPCIIRMLKEDGDFRSRWLFTLYMKEMGHSADVTNEIAKKYFSKFKRTDRYKDNYTHYKKVKTLNYVYSKEDFFPNCATIYSEGKCPGRCKHFPIENRFYK